MADKGEPGANQAVVTSIDDFANYVNTHGETDSTTIAKELNVPQSVIEAWADVLEKANIVHISYKAGKMYISKAIASPTEASTVVHRLEEKRQSLADEVSLQLQDLEAITSKIAEFSSYLTALEKAYKQQGRGVSEITDKIKAYANEAYSLQKKIAESKEYIDKFKDNLNKELAALGEKQKVLETFLSGSVFSDVQRLIDDINTKLAYAKAQQNAMRDSFEKELEEERRKFIELSEGIRHDIEELNAITSQLSDQVADYKNSIKAYSDEYKRLKSNIGSETSKIIDETSKAAEQANEVYASATKELDSLTMKLNEFQNQFKDLFEFENTLDSVKKELQEVVQERDSLQKELTELSKQLESLRVMDIGEAGKAAEGIQAAEQKTEATGKRLREVVHKLNDAAAKTQKMGAKKK